MTDEWTDTTLCESTRGSHLSGAWHEFATARPSATNPAKRCDTDSLGLDLWLRTLHDVAHLELG
jgi:hypothetical protein